ncbi:hypothetical protein [Erythrobacter rubeus]|uniref:hypothetical protein n=1 Tax=Erythrobacter rubeus TaxID=2760803 RepID=UPI0018F8C027|nr:hypothetical protein [Erythrobacter rubeus]
MKCLVFVLAAASSLSSAASAHEILHADHASHTHAADCGHTALEHGGHIDYIHDGHLHHGHDGHVDEHMIVVSSTNPEAHELATTVTSDDHPHDHEGEEHQMIQHGSHMDFVHNGRLHHVHGDHTDDHGPVKLVTDEMLALR